MKNARTSFDRLKEVSSILSKGEPEMMLVPRNMYYALCDVAESANLMEGLNHHESAEYESLERVELRIKLNALWFPCKIA